MSTREVGQARGVEEGLEQLAHRGARVGLALERALWVPRPERGPGLEWTAWAPGPERALERSLCASGPERALERTAWAPGTERTAWAPGTERTAWAPGMEQTAWAPGTERTPWAHGSERALERIPWAPGTERALERTPWAHGWERALERTASAPGNGAGSGADCIGSRKRSGLWSGLHRLPETERALERTASAPGPERALKRSLWPPGWSLLETCRLPVQTSWGDPPAYIPASASQGAL